MKKYYEIFPSSKNGELFWCIKYKDNTKEFFRFNNSDTVKEIKIRTQNYLMKKRKDKINKILNGK